MDLTTGSVGILRFDRPEDFFGDQPVAFFIVMAKAAERKQPQRIASKLKTVGKIDDGKVQTSNNRQNRLPVIVQIVSVSVPAGKVDKIKHSSPRPNRHFGLQQNITK